MSSRDVDVPKHDVVARYMASERRMQSEICACSGADTKVVDRERRERVRTEGWHPLNAKFAERSWGAPLNGRSTGVVAKTTDFTDVSRVDENTADGRTAPLVKRAVAIATLDFRWNSCRFIATRFQLGLRAHTTPRIVNFENSWRRDVDSTRKSLNYSEYTRG